MVAWRNSRERYGAIAIFLHWTTALAVIGMVGLGVVMVDIGPASPLKFELYQWHKSVGISILGLSLLRLLWRLANPVPPLPSRMRWWETALARLTHVGFYVLLLALPLSGWAMVSVSPWNIPTVLYGIVDWPHLPLSAFVDDRKSAESAMKEVHQWLGWSLVVLLALHVAGALKHHFVLRDETLTRMLPWFTRRPVDARG